MVKLRNVTVTLDEETARWARVEAAQRDISVSRMIGDMLRARMTRDAEYQAARDRYFAQKPWAPRTPGQPLPSRDELHQR